MQDETALTGETQAVGGTDGGIVASVGPPAQIQVKSSIYSMEFWLTAIISLGLGFGVMKGWFDVQFAGEARGEIVTLLMGALAGKTVALGVIFGLVNKFIVSRGKLKSNATWATASMNSPLVKNKNIVIPNFVGPTDHAVTIAALKGELAAQTGLNVKELLRDVHEQSSKQGKGGES